MDIRRELGRIPAPDPTAPDRIWRRFERTRNLRGSGSPTRWLVPVAAGLCSAAAAAALWMQPHADARQLTLEPGDGELAWSEEVNLRVDGQGHAEGTDRDVVVHWQAGTLEAEVRPRSGTDVRVVTEEATVHVVGTVFSVTRDRLGVTTEVARGKVEVSCAVGWSGMVTPASGPKTCLPVRPALLLGRADALVDAGAPTGQVLEAVALGLERAEPDSAVYGELLARRASLRSLDGDASGALEDARRYLDRDGGPRRDEMHRLVGWVLLAEEGCEAALPELTALAPRDAQAAVLAGECEPDADKARDLLRRALAAGLDPAWDARARAALAHLEDR